MIAISTALAHPDVKLYQEFPQNPVSAGDLRGGPKFRVTIGAKRIELGGSCEGAPPGCEPIPQGLELLRETLQQIDSLLGNAMSTTDCAGIAD